jgi:ethanolamine ammonia-lyase large subunit
LIAVAKKCEVVTRFRNTIGLKGHFATRLQPNHPTDDPKGVAASLIDGLLYGSGDACIGINPATDSPAAVLKILMLIDKLRQQFEIPTQSCVLSHITTTIRAGKQRCAYRPLFSIYRRYGAANSSFGISLALLEEAYAGHIILKPRDGR